MQFVCFSFDFEINSLKLLDLIIEETFMGYLTAVFLFVVTNWGCSCKYGYFPVGVVQGGWTRVHNL